MKEHLQIALKEFQGRNNVGQLTWSMINENATAVDKH